MSKLLTLWKNIRTMNKQYKINRKMNGAHVWIYLLDNKFN